MKWMTLQLIEVAVLLAIGVGAHVTVMRARQAYLDELEALAGRVVGLVAAAADVLVALVYLAFIAAVVPLEGNPVLAGYHVEDVFDVIALGALLVGLLEVVSLRAIHRTAHRVEPWSSAPTPAT